MRKLLAVLILTFSLLLVLSGCPKINKTAERGVKQGEELEKVGKRVRQDKETRKRIRQDKETEEARRIQEVLEREMKGR